MGLEIPGIFPSKSSVDRLPLPSAGSTLGDVPRLQQYYQQLRLPTPHPTALRCLRLVVPLGLAHLRRNVPRRPSQTDQAKPDHPAAPPLIQSGCSTSTTTDPRRHGPIHQAVRAPRRAWRRSLKPQTFAAERRPPRTVAQATHRPALSANCPGRSDLLTSTEGWDRGRASAATPGLWQIQVPSPSSSRSGIAGDWRRSRVGALG